MLGTTLGGKYRVERLLGEGGMGEVATAITFRKSTLRAASAWTGSRWSAAACGRRS